MTKIPKETLKMTEKEIKYSEPADYFPKEIRKRYKLGEYAEKRKNLRKHPKIKKERNDK